MKTNSTKSRLYTVVETSVLALACAVAIAAWTGTSGEGGEAAEESAEAPRPTGEQDAEPSPPPGQTPAQTPTPAPSLDARVFTDGLPQGGQWRGRPALGDLDGDGDLDLVASVRRWDSSTPGNGLHVWHGDGRGGFSEARGDLRTDLGYGGSALGDVDADGDLDIAYSAHDRPPHVFLNDGAGGFGEHGIELPIDVMCADVALGDIDGDGSLDLAAIGFWPLEGGLWWFRGRGDGTFGERVTLLERKHYGASVDLVDVDADEDADLVAATSLGPRVWRNDGAGALLEWPVALDEPEIAGSDLSVAVIDLDDDGVKELIMGGMAYESHPPMRMLKLGGDVWVPFGEDLPGGEPFFHVTSVQLDGVGPEEVAAAGRQGIVILSRSESGGLELRGRLRGTTGVIHLGAGDVNGDGKEELVFIGFGGVRVLEPSSLPEGGA